jgi:hypothetical protein
MTRRMIRGRPWTPEEDVLLRGLAAIGRNVCAIANEMNRSEAGVRKRPVSRFGRTHVAAMGAARASRGIRDFLA